MRWRTPFADRCVQTCPVQGDEHWSSSMAMRTFQWSVLPSVPHPASRNKLRFAYRREHRCLEQLRRGLVCLVTALVVTTVFAQRLACAGSATRDESGSGTTDMKCNKRHDIVFFGHQALTVNARTLGKIRVKVQLGTSKTCLAHIRWLVITVLVWIEALGCSLHKDGVARSSWLARRRCPRMPALQNGIRRVAIHGLSCAHSECEAVVHETAFSSRCFTANLEATHCVASMWSTSHPSPEECCRNPRPPTSATTRPSAMLLWPVS